MCMKTHLFYEQLLAHGDALVESLLVFLQEFLLFINLPSQVTVSLLKKQNKEEHNERLFTCNINLV